MTMRAFLTAIANRQEITDVMVDFAQSRLNQLDRNNETRRTKMTPDKIKNNQLKEDILNVLRNSDETNMTASTIAQKVGMTRAKAASLCKQLAEEGSVTAKKARATTGKALCGTTP